MPTLGISDGMARVYGERNLHFIVVADDETGKKVSSEELKDFMERESGVRVDSMEYFRRGRMALLECSAGRSYSAECATAGIAGNRDTVSGDTVRSFESRDGFFYTLISDGMGSGKEAKTTSEFVTEFLSRALEFSSAKETVLKMLSHIIKRKNEECSATLDLFEIDLINGNAVFFKGGAAPSYVKRGSSIFRIRSRTAPLGVLKDVDIERIKVDIESDDYIIMLSDGIIQNADDAPWLLELLSKPPKRNLTEYADLILNTALKNLPANDDMTVAVTKIKRI